MFSRLFHLLLYCVLHNSLNLIPPVTEYSHIQGLELPLSGSNKVFCQLRGLPGSMQSMSQVWLKNEGISPWELQLFSSAPAFPEGHLSLADPDGRF